MAVLAFDCRRIWCWEDAVKVTTTCPVRNRKQPNSLPNQSRIIRTPHLLSSAARPKLPNCPASLIQISKYTLNAASFSLSIFQYLQTKFPKISKPINSKKISPKNPKKSQKYSSNVPKKSHNFFKKIPKKPKNIFKNPPKKSQHCNRKRIAQNM